MMGKVETIQDLAKEVTAYIAQLQTENAKLREVMKDLEECDRIHRTMLRQVTELKDKVEAENDKLRELVWGYDSALHRMCSQAQSYTNCHCSDCVLAKGYEDADLCSIDDLRREARRLGIEAGR